MWAAVGRTSANQAARPPGAVRVAWSGMCRLAPRLSGVKTSRSTGS